MDQMPIPSDDLLDVMEMTEKLEKYISRVLNGNELTLSMSALMSATVNCVMLQCETLEDVVFYRNIFNKVFDSAIRSIKLKGK